MENKRSPMKLLLAAAALSMAMGAVQLKANSVSQSLDKNYGELKHALGWDTVNLQTVEKDSQGRPTLERDSNAANKVERKTSYFSDGKLKTQWVTVISKSKELALTDIKKEWNQKGDLEHSFVQDNAYSRKGKQSKGQIDEENYTGKQLAQEIRKVYAPKEGSWKTVHMVTISYYEDGAIKQKLTEKPESGEKERETWSVDKSVSGEREKTIQKWNAANSSWE
jgi:hypothetical protein